jgi:hypothetical protein
MVRTLAQSHDELQAVAGRQAHVITLATGRTLARTIVADWLARYGSVLQTAEMRIVTRTLDETVHMLQRGEVSFACSITMRPLPCGWMAVSSAI